MKAVILQHEKSTPPGTTMTWLKKKGLSSRVFKLHESPSLPKLKDFEVLIICGGSMNVDQENQFSWMNAEKELIRSAIQENKMVVGLCLGAQLIANVLGAEVKRHSVTEVGWQEVQFKTIKSFNLGAPLKVFQWHSYTFAIPKGAIHLAFNGACENQAYSFQDNVLAFQFHPESDPDWIIECANDPELPHGQFCQSKEDILKNAEHQILLQNWYFKALDHLLINWMSSTQDPSTIVDLDED